jgi:hypothetical protein
MNRPLRRSEAHGTANSSLAFYDLPKAFYLDPGQVSRKSLHQNGVSMEPAVDPMVSWYVWFGLIIGTFLMTLIGTWLVARRIKN